MRAIVPMTFAAAIFAALPITASAQQAGPPPSQPVPAVAQPSSTNPPPATTTTDTTSSGFFSTSPSHWMAAGFIGANYGASTAAKSVDFGGQVGYLYKGVVGGEFLADFAPTFEVNNAFLGERPFVNAYMANAMATVPIGHEHQFEPYVSGGFGAIQLWSGVLNTTAVPATAQTSVNQSKAGGDIGFGVLGFAGNVGIRGDIRYFRAFTNSTLATAANGTLVGDAFSQNLLSGLDFWRANIGIAFRW